MEVAIPAVILAAIVAALVLAPLRAHGQEEDGAADARADLEAAKEAKYREIHDAELDYKMGKLDEADWKKLDSELRGQAIEILARLDKLGG